MSNITTDDTQIGTKLGLNGKQIEVAQILADPSETRTIKAICEDIELPRRTFYNWVGKKEFVEFVNSLIDKYTDAELAGVWGALARKARTGDTHAMKLFFELKGKYKEVKEINHNIDNLTDEDREQRIKELMNKVSDQ
ncbi:phBC6A51 family helix-turn-helix protein [Cytobacillus sp. FSL H8-0458]|uniref:phBC6A51 family helix-turn-helix protein n=1 Tax=Cytobacillus sp. FSL H8-0458 TaxID=2975346 RepID=UPI0030FBF3A4